VLKKRYVINKVLKGRMRIEGAEGQGEAGAGNEEEED
jgi:hypothetical protein